MSLYVHRPSVTDPERWRPTGDDTFYVLSPVPHLGQDNPVDWEPKSRVYRAQGAQDARRDHARVSGPHQSTEMVFTPETFRDRYLSPSWLRAFRSSRASCKARGSARTTSAKRPRACIWSGRARIPAPGLPGVISSAEVLGKLVPDRRAWLDKDGRRMIRPRRSGALPRGDPHRVAVVSCRVETVARAGARSGAGALCVLPAGR